MNKMPRQIFYIVAIVILFSTGGCKNENDNQQLIIFHAGSLSVPFKQMKTQFEKENPNIKVLLEPAGSVQCARKITDLGRECDIMALADYAIIDQLLIPGFASWNIHFARNEMAIVYDSSSRYADQIDKHNWYDILLKDDVIFGRSDPNSDPCGYRAVLVTQLSEIYYKRDGLTKELLRKNQGYIRPKEVDLLALLESGSLDYIFLYKSVAEQHNLKYINLPDSINLSDPLLNSFYDTASVKILGKKPGETLIQEGKAMVYGVTILNNAPNLSAAHTFLEFLLEEEKGGKIMLDNGQSIIKKTEDRYLEFIPDQYHESLSEDYQ